MAAEDPGLPIWTEGVWDAVWTEGVWEDPGGGGEPEIGDSSPGFGGWGVVIATVSSGS